MTSPKFVDTSRGRFGYVEVGPAGGELVILQHGFPDDATTFEALQQALAEAGYRSIAPYLRGYAPSPTNGPYAVADLAADMKALIAALSPGKPVHYVGHDFGTQVGYQLCADDPRLVASAVMLAVAHSAIIFANMRRVWRQLWLSRYIMGMQVKGMAEWRVERGNFAYVDKLWRRWSPGLKLSKTHLDHVKQTLRDSMPAPVLMYRSGAWNIDEKIIPVPTLLLLGADDGCGDPRVSDGQQRLFSGAYRRLILPDSGHFLHHDLPEPVNRLVIDWIRSNPSSE